MSERLPGDGIDQLLREATAEIARLSPIAPELQDLGGPKLILEQEKESFTMNVRYALVAAAVAIVALVGVVLLTGGDAETDTADIVPTTTSTPATTNEPDNTTTTTTTTLTTTTTTTTTAPGSTTTIPANPIFETEATVLSVESISRLLTDESFRTDELGTPFTFANAEDLFVELNENGFLALRDFGGGFGNGLLTFVRPWHLVDPVAPNTQASVEGPGWPAADLEGWLSQLPPELEISNRETVEVGGQSTELFEIRISDEFDCVNDREVLFACFAFLNHPPFGDHPTPEVIEIFAAATLRVGLDAGSTYRVWWIDQNGETPIVAVAAAFTDSDSDFLDRANAVVGTVGFDSIEPSPFDQPDSVFE